LTRRRFGQILAHAGVASPPQLSRRLPSHATHEESTGNSQLENFGLKSGDAAFLMVDHQSGLFQTVKDISVQQLRSNVAAVAAAAGG